MQIDPEDAQSFQALVEKYELFKVNRLREFMKAAGIREPVRNVRNPARGMSKSGVYRRWASMMQRCYNENSAGFANYGGRGIKVAQRWHTFDYFYADMGEAPPGLSLDRIDVNGNYCLSNCRWATASQQAKNTRLSKRIAAGNGIDIERVLKNIPQWALNG
jgi:hypothetical protein